MNNKAGTVRFLLMHRTEQPKWYIILSHRHVCVYCPSLPLMLCYSFYYFFDSIAKQSNSWIQSDKELTRNRPTVGVPALAERDPAIRHLKLKRKLHVKQDFYLEQLVIGVCIWLKLPRGLNKGTSDRYLWKFINLLWRQAMECIHFCAKGKTGSTLSIKYIESFLTPFKIFPIAAKWAESKSTLTARTGGSSRLWGRRMSGRWGWWA